MLETRLNRLRHALQRESLDALALIPGPTLVHTAGTSFHLMERPVVLLAMPGGEPPVLILPEFERSKGETSPLRPTLFTYGEDPAERAPAFAAALRHAGLAGKRIGVESLRMRFLELRLLEAAAPGATIVGADDGHQRTAPHQGCRRAAGHAPRRARRRTGAARHRAPASAGDDRAPGGLRTDGPDAARRLRTPSCPSRPSSPPARTPPCPTPRPPTANCRPATS